MSFVLPYGFVTDKGNVRELNEDFLSYSREDEFSIYVVGDGMGGHNKGEVASKLAVENISKRLALWAKHRNLNLY